MHAIPKRTKACSNHRAVTSDPSKFETLVEAQDIFAQGWVQFDCPTGAIFNDVRCQCEAQLQDIAALDATSACNPLLTLAFTPGNVKDAANNQWVNNRAASITEGEACFNPADSAYMSVPAFNNFYWGSELKVTGSVNVTLARGQQMAIVGNCAKGRHVAPSVYIGVRRDVTTGLAYIQAQLLTDGVPDPVVVEVPYTNGPQAFVMVYDGSDLRMTSDQVTRTTPLTGMLLARQSDLLIGHPTLQVDTDLDGCLADLQVTQCGL